MKASSLLHKNHLNFSHLCLTTFLGEIYRILSVSCTHPTQSHVTGFASRLLQPCLVAHIRITRLFLLQYCKEEDRRTLVDLFYQDDQFLNSGNAYVQDSYSEKVSLMLYQHAHSPYWFHDHFVLIDKFITVICLFSFQ